MKAVSVFAAATVLFGIGFSSAFAESDPFERQRSIVYMETHGVGLLVDIFTPKENANGLAIVDVVSGAWHSDAGKLRDHERAQMFNIYCSRGFTVFGIRPGSVTKFTGSEMLAHVHQGIRYAKSRADDFNFDPDRMGIIGASAGGHLALLATVHAEDGNPKSKDALKKLDTHLKAVAVFFPPTDFLEWGDQRIDFSHGQISAAIGQLLFAGGVDGQSEDRLLAMARRISPLHNIPDETPPFLLIHGDADPLVPLNQSRKFVDAVIENGGAADLIVKEGGAHPWPTINEEVEVMADWFEKQL
jgi:acetyl esterase/lipase